MWKKEPGGDATNAIIGRITEYLVGTYCAVCTCRIPAAGHDMVPLSTLRTWETITTITTITTRERYSSSR